jgi:hypothetical protein
MDQLKAARHHLAMPTVELEDHELATALQSFRRFVELALQDAKQQSNPGIKLTFMQIAQAHQDTVEKLEAARNRAPSLRMPNTP